MYLQQTWTIGNVEGNSSNWWGMIQYGNRSLCRKRTGNILVLIIFFKSLTFYFLQKIVSAKIIKTCICNGGRDKTCQQWCKGSHELCLLQVRTQPPACPLGQRLRPPQGVNVTLLNMQQWALEFLSGGCTRQQNDPRTQAVGRWAMGHAEHCVRPLGLAKLWGQGMGAPRQWNGIS